MDYVMDSQFGGGGMGDSPTLHPNWLRSAPSPQYKGHWSLFSTQSNWSEHESYYHSSPSIAKTGNIWQVIYTMAHIFMAWCIGIGAILSYPFNFGNRPGTFKRAIYTLRHDTRYPVEIGSRKPRKEVQSVNVILTCQGGNTRLHFDCNRNSNQSTHIINRLEIIRIEWVSKQSYQSTHCQYKGQKALGDTTHQKWQRKHTNYSKRCRD
jgi:hypothetical protein